MREASSEVCEPGRLNEEAGIGATDATYGGLWARETKGRAQARVTG